MKKLMILSALILCLNIACKCDCEPPPKAIINFVVKNLAGEDLLNPFVNGSYSKAEIKLYKRSVSNVSTPIEFEIHSPILPYIKSLFYFTKNPR